MECGCTLSKRTSPAGGGLFLREGSSNTLSRRQFLGNTSGAAIGAAGPFSYVGNPVNQQIIGLGASYRFDWVTFGADYTRTLFDDANGTTSTVTFSNYEVWMNYVVEPTLSVGGEYTFTYGKLGYSGENIGYHLAGLVADKKLSKRTEVYAMASFQRVIAGAKTADIFDGAIASASSGRNQMAFRLGIVHKF